MEPTAVSLLLEVLQDALTHLDIFHIKGTKWDASQCNTISSTSIRSVTVSP